MYVSYHKILQGSRSPFTQRLLYFLFCIFKCLLCGPAHRSGEKETLQNRWQVDTTNTTRFHLYVCIYDICLGSVFLCKTDAKLAFPNHQNRNYPVYLSSFTKYFTSVKRFFFPLFLYFFVISKLAALSLFHLTLVLLRYFQYA